MGSCRPDADVTNALTFVNDADEQFSGGTTTLFDATENAFNHAVPGLSTAGEDRFVTGNSLFRNNWVTAPASTTARDGLGPMFNAASCSSCHALDGRGRPPVAGEVGLGSMLVRLSLPGQDAHGGPLPDPAYGEQLSNHGIAGVAAEGEVEITYAEEAGSYPDGVAYSLRRPTYSFQNLAYGPLGAGVLTSPRVAPQLPGLGLLEALPEATIVALADPADLNGDGISGRPNYVWDTQSQRRTLGRFGWKANQPNIKQQTAGAFVGDMGITSTLFRAENCTSPQQDCQRAPSGNTSSTEPYELSDVNLGRVAYYSATLAVPGRRQWQDPAVVRGKQLFVQALNCGGCHRPKLQTGESAIDPTLSRQTIRPYTDLLLHDMGAGLADGRPDFEATGTEWRTPPLWGIGLFRAVNRHTFYLHDGRARSLEEAVLWHGGEAQRSRDAFVRLPQEDRAAVLKFLNSL
ncbi:MAG: c-type cytochrome [Hymenobacteraceae bacterium]|nr:c-type cytochrome [Hymenobacteraceae bacterium]